MIQFFISHLNSIGLIIDIIGVAILFFVVISPSEQVIRIDENVELERKKKLNRKELVLKIGFGFIILGFIFQLLSNET